MTAKDLENASNIIAEMCNVQNLLIKLNKGDLCVEYYNKITDRIPKHDKLDDEVKDNVIDYYREQLIELDIELEKATKEKGFKPLQDLIGEIYISTTFTPDSGFETMAFNANKDAHKVHNFHYEYWIGVDFYNPIKELTRHYDTAEQAISGHKETIKNVKTCGEKYDKRKID